MNILEAYITMQNIKYSEGYFSTVVDADHWAENGVYTPIQFDRFMREASVYDAHKEAYGFRDRSVNLSELTEAELSAYEESVYAECDSEAIRMAAEQEQAIKDFEKLISETIRMGAGDLVTALRWLECGDSPYGYGEFEYDYRLPYGFIEQRLTEEARDLAQVASYEGDVRAQEAA